ncbi:MAG: phosphoenolpyruvate carboxykinase [Pseudomonadota bacterium]
MESGVFNPNCRVEDMGLTGLAAAHYNLGEAGLVQAAIQRDEGELGQGGTFLCNTGKHTGRSPQDKFVVREASVEDDVWWENNKPMSPEHFETLYRDMLAHLKGREVFVQDLFAGADPEQRLNVRMINELAWHSLFIRHMLRRPELAELANFTPEFTVINCPSFKADPARHGCRTETIIAVSFERKLILVGDSSYAGENKKGIFSVLNFLLPGKGVMPMHCSANHAVGNPDDAAIFFGLSGTGKTTLSADPDRTLLGDDEHGWTESGIFNFEGGCYAKTINLSPEAEPEIYATCSKFATVIENMVYDPHTKELDYKDDSLTTNMRCAYPLHYISNASETGMAGIPKNVVMLTCDAFGVMPPIARLTPAQAMYHFLTGFTSKMAGTEKGVNTAQPTFSTCFGAPFMTRRPEVYGALLRDKIASTGAQCWLVNTGWTGGGYGVGSRMPIRVTRTLLSAALNGSLNEVEFRVDPNFGFEVPTFCEGISTPILNPRQTWEDAAAYDAQASELVAMFVKNFAQYEAHVGEDVRAVALKAA